MKRFLIILFFLLLGGVNASSQEQQAVPYTLADRDRLIKVEAEVGALRSEMNSLRSEMGARLEAIDKQFAHQQQQINDLKTLFYWGFGIMLTLMIFMLGYMIWDRRTALKPALDRADNANDKTRNLISVLREYARNHPDLAEILRANGLL
jgi:predicted PurR-regulated permease PerM